MIINEDDQTEFRDIILFGLFEILLIVLNAVLSIVSWILRKDYETIRSNQELDN
jgi:hypothetical protein